MTSDEGLNAYGAVTWGQFFIYQGFNDRAGWMHTSSGVDAIDEYLETVTKKGDRLLLQVRQRGAARDGDARSPCRTGRRAAWREKEFTVYRTHHGPVVREADGKWVSVRLMQEPLKALHAVVPAHEGDELQGVPADDGAAHQLVEQHDLRRRRRRHRLLPRQLHPAARHDASTGRSRSTAAIRRPSGRACMSVDESSAPAQSGERLALQHEQLAVVGGRRRAARSKRTIPAYVETRRRESRAASTRFACCRHEKDFTLDSLIAAAYDSYLPCVRRC